jgi:hypothetical protein
MKNIATQLEKSAVSVPRYGIGLSEKKLESSAGHITTTFKSPMP